LPGGKVVEDGVIVQRMANMDVKLLHRENKLLKRNTHKEYRSYLENIKSKWEDRTGKTGKCGW
jgi:hypothetical protein